MKNAKAVKSKSPKLVQSSLGLFSEMDKDVFSSVHDEIMCWTDTHAQDIITKLWPDKNLEIVSKCWEKPVTTEEKQVERLVGFIDLAVVTSKWPPWHVYFEIKTQVRPGADLRQINAYKFYLNLQSYYHSGKSGSFVVLLLCHRTTATQSFWPNRESSS